MKIRQRKEDVPKVELVNFKDPKKFADIANLVDKEDFLQDMLLSRGTIQKSMKIELPTSWEPKIDILEKLWKPFFKNEKLRQKEILDKAAKKYHLATAEDKLTKEIRDGYEMAFRINPSDNLWLEVKKLRQKYNQSLQMEKVILKAIIHNEVRDEDYSNCYITTIYPLSEYPFIQEEPLMVMVLSPSVRQKDIETVYNRDYYKASENYKDFGYAPEYPAVDTKSRPMIIRDRELYWLFTQSYSYVAVAEAIKDHNATINKTSKFTSDIDHDDKGCLWCKMSSSDNDILKAVEAYDKWLHPQS
jgi:hypothetical protein